MENAKLPSIKWWSSPALLEGAAFTSLINAFFSFSLKMIFLLCMAYSIFSFWRNNLFNLICLTLEVKKTKKSVRTYVFHMLKTYVMILCNWLILWQNALYLYLGRFRMCLNTLRNHVSRSSVEAFKSIQENKLIMQIH